MPACSESSRAAVSADAFDEHDGGAGVRSGGRLWRRSRLRAHLSESCYREAKVLTAHPVHLRPNATSGCRHPRPRAFDDQPGARDRDFERCRSPTFLMREGTAWWKAMSRRTCDRSSGLPGLPGQLALLRGTSVNLAQNLPEGAEGIVAAFYSFTIRTSPERTASRCQRDALGSWQD